MPKRKKSAAPKKAKNKKNAPELKCEEVPSPAKKPAVSSTSQLEEAQISSCTRLPVDLGTELQSEAPLSPPGLSCTCCNFSASTKSILEDHMQQHKLNCPWCPFNSLTYLEVIHHCKFKHDKSTEIDTIPCHACVYCSFMTYIPEHLEKHTALKHPDEPFKFIPKIISKQVSAGVRIDDAMFCQTLSNNTDTSFFMKIEAGSHTGGKSNPIIIDAAQEMSKDIKHEANSGSVSETCVEMTDLSIDAISKQVLINYLLTDFAASEELKAECGTFETKCEVKAVEASHLAVKLERLYCLTCPYSSISIDEVKCHTVGQHPVGAAAATYNANGESVSMDDTTFFCVRQSCTFSSFDYSSYQRHLVDCCAFQKALSVLERARLKTTIMHILDCQRKYAIKLEDAFLNFALSCLGNHLEADQAIGVTSSNLGSQTSLPPTNESKSSIATSNHFSLPETTFIHMPAHNQQTSSAGMSLPYTQQGNIQTNYLDSTQQSQSNNQGVSNVRTTDHMLDDATGKNVNILNTFSLSRVPSVDPNISRNIPSNVSFHSSNASSNVMLNLNNLPSNVPIISMNALSNIPVNPSSDGSIVPGNRNIPQLHQFPVNNISNLHLDQPGNEKQQQASFSAGLVSQDATANVHNFLVGANSASLARQHQPNVLINSGQCPVETGSMSQASLASNSAAHIYPGTTSIRHNLPLSANQVSYAGQQQPGVFINSGQSHCVTNWHQQNSLASNSTMHTNMGILTGPDNKCLIGSSNSLTVQGHSANQAAADLSHFNMGSPHLTSQQSSSWVASNVVTAQNQGVSGNINYASTAGRSNNIAGMNQMRAGSIYQNVPVSKSNMTSDRMVNGQQCGIFTTAANINQLTASNLKHISPASQVNTNRDSTIFGQESGNLVTGGVNEGTTGSINHTLPASHCNTIEGRTVFGQQSDNLMTVGNSQCGLYHNGQQPGNLTAASLNHDKTGNQNQMSRMIDPMISQETCQTQHNVNQTGLGISTQRDTSDSNTILVFDMSASKSKLPELTYGNQQQLPPGTFYQPTSLITQKQTMVRPVNFAESVGRSSMDSQTGTPRLESTIRCSSAENNSRSQFSRPSFSQSGYFTSESESVSSHFGSQTADGADNNRTICSSLPEQFSSAQILPNVSNTSCIPSIVTGSALPAQLTQSTHALRSVSVHTGLRMTASPQRANPAGPVIISSLASRMHHQQNPGVRRTFMGHRGAALSGASPRGSPAVVAPQRHQRGVMRRRPVGRGRGQAMSPSMLPGSGRASHNAVCCDDDDDVIMTSGFTPGDSHHQNRPLGCRLPVAQPQWTPSASSHHDSQISKVRVAARSSQTPQAQQSKKRVDVGGHFENLACELNASTNADLINVAPEDDVEILSVVAGETRSGPTQGTGLEVFQKARAVESLTAVRGQNDSVNWNLKDNFSNGLSNVYSDILNSSLRLPRKSSVRHAVSPRREATQANISVNQQSLVRPPAYSEQNDVAGQGSATRNPSPKGTPIRASLRQISPAGLSSSVPGRRQMQQRAAHPAQLQKISPPKALISNITSSSKSPRHSQQHSSVIIVDADRPTPSRQPNKNIPMNKESPQQGIFVDPEQNRINKEPAQDVIILDADPSEDPQQTEKDNLKTAKTPEYFIILDGDSSENLIDEEKNMSAGNEHAVANRKLTPAFSVPSTRGHKTMRPQSVGHNICNKRIYTPRGQLAHPFAPAHQGAPSNNRVRPQLGQHAFTGSNGMSPATRHAVRATRAASVSPVSVSHPNHSPNNTATKMGPQPASRRTSVQSRDGPRAANIMSTSELSSSLAVSTNATLVLFSPVTSSHPNHYPNNSVTVKGLHPASRDINSQNRIGPQIASELRKSPAISTNVPAASVSPASVSHPNNYPGSTVTQKQPQPQPTSRGSYFQNKNGPQTVTSKAVTSELSNLAVSTNVPVNSGVSLVTSGCSAKASVSEIKVEISHSPVLPRVAEKAQLDSTSKESHTSLEDPTELLNGEIKQSKVPNNLPALLLAKFKKCANLKHMNSVVQQAVVSGTSAGICSQRTSLDSDAKGANKNLEVFSSQSNESSNNAGKVVCTPPPFQPLPKLPASLSIAEGSTVQEVADLNESNNSLLSAMDSDKIIIYDLDVNEKQIKLSPSSEGTTFFNDVNEQQQHSVPAVQNQLSRKSDQQNVTLNTSSGKEIIKRSSQFSTVRNTRSSKHNFNLANSISEAEKPTPTAVSERLPTDVDNCQSGHKQTVEITKHNSYLCNQAKDFSEAQLKDPPVLHNQLKDSPTVPSQLIDPPVLHNQLKPSPAFQSTLYDSPVFHSQLQESPELHNQLRHSPNVTNQQGASRSVPGATLLPSETKPQAVSPQFQVTNEVEPSPSSNLQELHADNQTMPLAGPTETTSQVFTKGRGKSRKGTKRLKAGEPEESLKKTKKQMTKKKVDVDESENKESVIEKTVVRHSDRLVKTVLKDLKISGSDTDAQLSDDSEFCLKEEDLDGDTDSEWSDGQGKNNKVKSKGADTSQDPTAFDTMIKGSFKCWLCRKLYSRCAFAKDHIVKKHFAGLCVLDLDRSKETNSVCLLMFCPRKCTYASNTLDGINSHMKTCKKLVLINGGINFVEINQVFLDQKYTELVNLPLERALCPVLVRKPRDLSKPPKRKIPKSSLSVEKSSSTLCGAAHTALPFPDTPEASPVPVATPRHTVDDRTFMSGASQNASSFRAHNLQGQQMNQGQRHTGHSAAVRGQVSHQQRSNPYVVNKSQMSMQLPVTLTPRAAFSKNVPSGVNFQKAHQRSLPLIQNQEQQLIASYASAPSNNSAPHHLNESYKMDQSTEHENIYVVEDNDIICLE